jgi:hypothetical protein
MKKQGYFISNSSRRTAGIVTKYPLSLVGAALNY